MSLIYAPINELPFAPNFEGNDYLLIWDISQPANQARRLTFTALASFLAYTSREFEWADIINKPDTFPPAVHTHIPADISGLNGAIDARLNNLPNGAIIGGVAHFFQNSPPAMRNDGSLIQDGDRWDKPVDGGILGSRGCYIREGNLWVTAQKIFFSGGYGTAVNASTQAGLTENGYFLGFNEVSGSIDRGLNFPQFANIFVSGFAIRFYSSAIGTNFDANNRFDLRANILNSPSSSGELITTVNSGMVLAQNGALTVFPLSSVINVTSVSAAVSASVRVKNVVGSPAFSLGILRPYWAYILQGIHP